MKKLSNVSALAVLDLAVVTGGQEADVDDRAKAAKPGPSQQDLDIISGKVPQKIWDLFPKKAETTVEQPTK